MRFSIAAWLLTKAPAISSTLKPHRMLRMRATCASSDNRGWQQENIMRNRSSLIALAAKSSSTTGASVHSLSRSRPSSGAKVRAVRWRRRTSSARFFAVAISHAEGFSGGPWTPHLQRAAEGVLDDILRQREVVDAKDPRQRGDHASRLAPEEMIVKLHLHVQDSDRAHLNGASRFQDRTALGELDSLHEVIRLDQCVTADDV